MKHILAILLLLVSFTTQAFEAGHCPVGPFGTDGDTGSYTGRCHELTGSEICEIYLEAIDNGDIRDIDPAKVRFCEASI